MPVPTEKRGCFVQQRYLRVNYRKINRFLVALANFPDCIQVLRNAIIVANQTITLYCFLVALLVRKKLDIRFEKNKDALETEKETQLPGQVYAITNTVLENEKNMNTPGDVRGHDSAFTGMYETDSNYRWRKVRGNLDLFVMERNERHLTSLQWKWQKMSKTRRRTPVYEGYYNSPSPNDDAYKNMPESARTRSRAESRQRMREELDSYFYDRWKTVDDRQQSANKSSAEGNVPVVSREALKHASVPHGDIKHHFENDTQYPGSNHYPGVDTSKWSRHGYIPNQHYLPSMNSPYPNVYSNEIIPGQQPPYSIPRRKPGPNHHDNYPQSFGFTPRREFPDQGMGLSPLEQKSRGDTYNPFGTNNGKKSDEHGHYWTPRSRNQLFSPEDVGYPNYGYSPDYHNSGRNYQSPFSDHPDFQGQQYNYPSMNSSSMRTPYEYGRNNNDPWMKKNMAAYDPTLKGFYEEMRLEGNKKLNEETTVRLLNEQKEMEADLHKLQQILQEEMQKHKESEGVNEKLNAKIENLESQIAELNSRLSDNHAVLEENEAERRNVKNGIEGPVNSGLHHNRPLFILSDPDHGATAALAQGRCPYHDEDNQDYNPLHSCEIMHYQSPFDTSQRFSHSTYSETPPSCVVHIDPLDITQKQQKELKADLEKQMAQLKEELKRQLEEQIPKTAENSESVIDVRVTLLEKQIEEMNKKIQRAESIIQKTEKEKRTKHEKESTNSPAEAKKDPDDKSDTNQNKIDETDLTKNLKLHKLSPKLPPSLSPKISPTAHLKISPGPNTPALQHNDDCGSRLKVSCYQSSSSSLGKQKEDFKMETFSSSKTQKSSKMTIDSIKKDVDKNKKNPLKWSSTGDSKTKLTSVSAVSETSSLSGSKTTRFSEEPKQVKEVEREMTVTTMDSEMTQTNEEFSRIQSRTSNWASTSGGWANGRRSLLYGLGTNWCVCPKQIWKHLGDDTDDEPITRRKCISVIMGTILAILLFAIIVGLIIGLANMEGPTESPIRFVVIPSELDLEDESNAAEGN
ncbi:unnamed protein product [Clavelina lepadiformis]|uniref:Uncharacterized protein n=1 Tax=Clavelina lepadiformis TaxID=159417 RepID=A0ABP0F2S3_CLALP